MSEEQAHDVGVLEGDRRHQHRFVFEILGTRVHQVSALFPACTRIDHVQALCIATSAYSS